MRGNGSELPDRGIATQLKCVEGEQGGPFVSTHLDFAYYLRVHLLPPLLFLSVVRPLTPSTKATRTPWWSTTRPLFLHILPLPLVPR